MLNYWVRAVVAASLCAGIASVSATTPVYRVIDHIPVPDSRWDYGAVDPGSERLYLGRIGGVLAVDLATHGVTPVLVRSALVHGVLPLEAGLVMSTNGEDDTVALFEGTTGRVLATLPVGKEPDAIVRDPASGLVITTNEGSHDLSLIDAVQRRVVGNIGLPGQPEYPAVGRPGLLYDNIADRNEIAVIDLAARHVVRTIPLRGCMQPTGLAYDAEDDLLISVCRNGAAKFIRAVDGHDIATVDVGAGPDAALYDVARHLAFVPAGGPGTLTVIEVAAAAVRKLQTLTTRPGSRTAVLDAKTGRLYVPAAEFATAADPSSRRTGRAGSFEILVIGPTP
jgi:DNA-binding beta-propeller fold protein YncE